MAKSITAGASWYLDLIRSIAAVLVVISHLRSPPFFSEGLQWIPLIGHEMVVIFFVLSGFVISHTVTKHGCNWKDYATSRFSRIVSVAYPALILTAACDAVGRLEDPVLYAIWARSENFWARIIFSALFLHQSWPLFSWPGTNTPFWSLAYEVWYYVLFGIWTFLRPGRWRWLALIGAGMVAGPRILILLPVWLAGVVAHRSIQRWQLSSYCAVTLFCGSLLLGVGLVSGVITPFLCPFPKLEFPLYFSEGWWGDYQIGVVIALNFFSAVQMFRQIDDRWLVGPLKTSVRFFADRSYSLYAYHMPILFLISVSLPYRKASSLQVILAVIPAFVLTGVLYQFTEKRRDSWRALANRLVDWITQRSRQSK